MPKTKKTLSSLAFLGVHRRFVLSLCVCVLFMLGAFLLHSSTQNYMADILGVAQPAAFDGTGLPVAQVPNWTALSAAESHLTVATMNPGQFMPLPTYDPKVFGAKLAALDWTANKASVNALLTYSTPYMGSYESGSTEYSGSHLAVDIRMPTGTPVMAIANGRVATVANSGSSGFGIHIVLEHDNVPQMDNTTATLYSGYAHRSVASVKMGDIVKRGDVIGMSGNSGDSTGPHLHFQIDNGKAPWHPWWPFSSSQASAAGLDFFTGINAGLGKDAALQNTVNPLVWVQRFLSSATPHPDSSTTLAVVPASGTSTTTTTPATSTTASTPASTTKTTTVTTSTPAAAAPPKFSLSGDNFALVGNSANILVTAQDASGKTLQNFVTPDRVVLVASGNDVSLTPNSLTPSDFANGKAQVMVKSSTPETVQIKIASTDTPATTDVKFISQVATIAKFGVLPQTDVLLNTPTTISIQALDDTGSPTPNASIGGTVNVSLSNGTGSFSPASLTAADFHNGLATVKLTYTSGSDPFSITARAGSLMGTSVRIVPQLFSDVGSGNTHFKAISYLKQKNIISGYDDGTFQPDKTVNRAEALKILLGGLNIAPDSAPKLKFSDTDTTAWYAPFVSAAVNNSIVAGYKDGTFQPATTVNRAEYLKMLVGAAHETPPTSLSLPYTDVKSTDWFAPFVQFAVNKNLLMTTTGTLSPTDGMTRGEVADTLYRLLITRADNATKYSESLQ